MKKILVPTDFSNTAGLALDYAINLAKQFNANIYLLNAYDVPHAGVSMMISIDDLLKEESLKKLEREEDRLLKLYPELNLRTHSVSGAADKAIAEFCKEMKIDLIAMGTTGASGWQGKLFGSNTSNLVGNVATPIIAIPNGAKITLPSHIAIATDLKVSSNAATYRPIKEFAQSLGSNIRFLNITNENTQENLSDFEKDFGNEIDFVSNNDIENGIQEYLNSSNTDLLVTVAKRHGFFEALFKSSVSKQLAKELTIPLMILQQ